RGLGASSLGAYLLMTSMSNSFAFLAFGLSDGALKLVAEKRGQGRPWKIADIVVAAFAFYAGMGLVAAAAAFWGAPFLARHFTSGLGTAAVLGFRIAGLQFAVFQLLSLCMSVLKGIGAFHLSALALAGFSVSSMGAAAVVVVSFHAGLVGAIFAAFGGTLVALLVAASYVLAALRRERIPLRQGRLRREAFSQLFGFGAAVTATNMAGLLHAQAERFLISAMLGPQNLAAFDLGVWCPAKLNTALQTASEPLFPWVAGRGGRSRRCLVTAYHKCLFLAALAAVAVLAPLAVWSRPVFHLWLGSAMPAY